MSVPDEILDRVGMAGKKNEIVSNLSHGEQRQIEISLALISNPKVLLLDEPTAGLSSAESALMTRTVQSLDPQITILIIEHDMDVAFQIAERISVFIRVASLQKGLSTKSGATIVSRRSISERRTMHVSSGDP